MPIMTQPAIVSETARTPLGGIYAPLIMMVASCTRILNVGCPGPPGTPGKAVVVECPGPPGTPDKAVGVLNWGCCVPAPMKGVDEGGPCLVTGRSTFEATP